ncbi:MAG: sigma-70 family RNA polymerase sigma factor [bacterium]
MASRVDEASFEGKVIALIPALRGYSRSLHGNAADADDLVQETLLRAIRHVDTFQQGTNLRAWLFTILRNRFYTSVMKSQREPVGLESCVSELATVNATQDLHMEVREVERAVIALPRHYRETLTFVVIEGGSYDAAAKHFDCDIGTIKSRINRSRKLIRQATGGPI